MKKDRSKTTNSTSNNRNEGVTNLDAPYHILRPHARADIYRYRDMYVRRRLVENHAVGVIRRAWILYTHWRTKKNKVYAWRVTLWFSKYMRKKKKAVKDREMLMLNSARAIQSTYRTYAALRSSAVIKIQRAARRLYI
jgi:hypothetical protein